LISDETNTIRIQKRKNDYGAWVPYNLSRCQVAVPRLMLYLDDIKSGGGEQ
jgi:hypothetical protein